MSRTLGLALVGIVAGSLIALIAIFATSGMAGLQSVGWYVFVAFLIIGCPIAIVGGAVWLAGRILHGTGSGGN